jgi:N-acyl amino acid synthase of PEP-CTERM/exosortase system
MLDAGFDIPVHYDRQFDVIRAATPSLVREAYRLRYQVYCVEHPFEDPEQQVGACESDDYDDRSIHTLLLHRRTGEIAGTSRVILPDESRFRPLPIATLLQGSDRRRFDRFPAAHTAELSRFAVSKQFRRRLGEERYADAGFGNAALMETERRLMPFVSLGLIRGLFGICLEYGITHLAAVMEPPLIRILHRLGLDFMPIGGIVMHHGLRQPCFALLDDLVQHSRETDSIVWQYAVEPLLREHNEGRRHAVAEPAQRVAI